MMTQKKIPIIEFLHNIKKNLSLAPKSFRQFVDSFIADTKGELWNSYDDLLAYAKRRGNYEKLRSGKLGHNLLQTYNAIAMKMIPDWNNYIFEVFKESLNYDNTDNQNCRPCPGSG